ncbi:DUF805 domain-containing protein [Actinomyces slackii]|uniref:Inner membrane protein yhaH n=1 Tax=Actinomyces slackii TaxID=52774 RepID=A0A448KDU7_9ACTO|nr:DUF805 domain-containing protein [Actinomyces slackii]VEG75093.1 Inner membrane protein yhaH [Actinomyces slackii]
MSYQPSPASDDPQPQDGAPLGDHPQDYAPSGGYPQGYPGGYAYPQTGGYPQGYAQPGGYAYPQTGGYPQGYAQPGGYYYPQPGGYPPGAHGYGAGYPWAGVPIPEHSAPMPGVGPGLAIKRFFQRYAQFRGYASPSEYWWIQIISLVVNIAIVYVFAALGAFSTPSSHSTTDTAPIEVLAMLTLFAYAIVLIIPLWAVTVRRLHDTGQSGWMALLALIPYIGGFIILILCAFPSRPHLYQPRWS